MHTLKTSKTNNRLDGYFIGNFGLPLSNFWNYTLFFIISELKI